MICKHNCEKLVNSDIQVIIEGQYIEMFALHWNQVGPQCVEDERYNARQRLQSQHHSHTEDELRG